ncbi:MAG TPA: transporter [Rhizomicrobium sp.]|nr:transporter [Rhizomicrobium sp.]
MKRSLLAFCLLALAAAPAGAVETGFSIYPKGMSDFMSGVLPPQPGLYFSSIYYHFNGSTDAAVRNGAPEFGLDMSLDAGFLRGTYVTDTDYLGGRYAMGGAIAVAGSSLNANLVSPKAVSSFHAGTSDFADSILTPVIVGWNQGNLWWNASFSLYLPTGGYTPGQFNIGRNVMGYMPAVAMTWFDPASGWDVSGAMTFVAQSRNEATDYQSGWLMHLDWGIGNHITPSWEIGLAGNWMQQLSDDSGTGAKLGPFRAQSFGLGPAATFATKWDGMPVSFTAKWERDVTHTNTIGGDLITVNATILF